MRNLKKLLALTLAMVMAFSLMLTANAAVKYEDFGDKDQITEEFKEAVQVLSGLEILQGDEKDGVKGFRPADTITRAEAAAIIYRIATQDVAGTQEKLYSDYGTFSDVNHDDWFAGYVGYCQNAGYIKGTTPTTFSPYLKVTGYEMLAMLLRVVGYGKTNEFTGPQWQVNVASLSQELGVINNVKSANFEHTLTMAARRDVVADLAFQTLVLVPTVTYTPALSYNDKTAALSTEFNPTLGQKNFGLWRAVPGDKVGTVTVPGSNAIVDMWGRPGYWWVKGGSKNSVGTDNKPIYAGSLGTDTDNNKYTYPKIVATIFETPKLTYTTQIKECDLAHDYSIATEKNFSLYVNDDTAITNNYRVVATDTVTPVGGQGRLTEVYGATGDHSDHRVVMIDTYLAKVTKTTDAVLDAAGHVIVPAKLELVVYDGVDGTRSTGGAYAARGTANANKGTAKTISKPANSADNWEYGKGDMILLNAYSLKQFPKTTKDKDHSNIAFSGAALDEAQNKAAFEDNAVYASKDGNATATWGDYDSGHTLTVNANVQVLGKAESQVAKQTVVYYDQNKHCVGGTDIPDAMLLYKDEAGVNTATDWAWYKDQYGNIIGIESVAAVNYGVITDIWSAFGQGDSNTDGTAKAIAKVKLADGSEVQYTVSSFLLSNTMTTATTANAEGHLDAGTATNMLKTLKTTGVTSAGTEAAADNTIRLVPKYDYEAGSGIMTAGEIKVWASAGSANASLTGELSVSPVASINKAADTNKTADKTYGVVIGNLFKFVTTDDGTMMAVEVAGDGTNSGAFAGLNNIQTSTTAAHNKLYKNLGYITVNNNAANGTIWLDDETKIMVYNPNTKKISTYNGVNELPSNLSITARANNVGEIDWAELDGDGRAEYIYLSGTFDGQITYGLFYTNNGASQWDNSTKKGTIAGYFNGEAGTITFEDKTLFDKVNNNKAYKGGLFALQLTDGVVSNVMARADTVGSQKLLADGATVTGNGVPLTDLTTNIKTVPVANNVPFKAGIEGNNPYTANTQAVYFYDDNTGTADGTANVEYDAATRQVKLLNGEDPASNALTPTTYTITPNTKIVGQLDFLNDDNVDWLNDVTIVYEPSAVNAIVEIYITTLPTVTPGDTPADTTMTLNSIRINDTAKTVEFYVSCAASGGYIPNATVTLKNTTTGATILSSATGTVTWSATENCYLISVANPGGSLNNVAGYLFEGTLSMTSTGGTNDGTYTCTFSGRGIL